MLSNTQYEDQQESQAELFRREKLILKGEIDFRNAVMRLNQAQNLMFASSSQRDISKAIKSFQSLEKGIHGIEANSLKIKRILETTRILSINAAIEAARAGDSGRKFTVVAEEIRNLANRTNECTNEVEEISGNMFEHGKINQSALTELESSISNFVTYIDALNNDANSQELMKIEENGFILTLLAKRLEDHASFLDNIIRNAGKIKNMSDHHTCAFGQWYDRHESEYRQIKGYKEIYKAHEAFHAEAIAYNKTLNVSILSRLFLKSSEILSLFTSLYYSFKAETQRDGSFFNVQ